MSSMHAIFLLLVVVAVLHGQKPDDCGEYACPSYTTVDNGDYEVRTYTGRSSWVKTGGRSFMGSGMMFMRLFRYINANNIKMTIPVLTKKQTGSSRIEMFFYLDEDTPPTPRSRSVSLVYMESKEFYVRSFTTPGGMWNWPSNSDFEREVAALRRDINDESLYDTAAYYRVGYTPPMHSEDRHSEVWLEKL